MKESDVQKAIVEWCSYRLRKDVVWHSIPNERKPKDMGNLMKTGLLPGVGDLFYTWRYEGAGYRFGMKIIYMEVKRPTTYKMGKRGKKIIAQRGGTQSDDQIRFQKRVEAIGCYYYVVDNLTDAIRILREHGLETHGR